jgi:uncharacterized membrane protein
MDGEQQDGLERRVARLEARVHELELLLQLHGGADVAGAPEPPHAGPLRHAGPQPALVPPPSPVWGAPPAPRRALPIADRPTVVPPPSPVPSAPSAPMSAPRPSTGWPVVSSPASARAADQSPRIAPKLDLRDLEERFAGRALAWIGGAALVAAAIFFLSLAFSRGWITEPMRVVIGLLGGSAALVLGSLSFDRRNPLLGNVLSAVGLGVVSISLFAATRGYGLVTPELGLLAALAAALASAVIAIRFNAREVAAFGLIAALIAPPMMGASPTTLTLGFIVVTLVGTTAIALFRSWRWLPSIAFVLAAPQLANWLLGGDDVAQSLIALAAFWLINIVAAGGEEVRIRRDDLRPSSATLVLANAAFLTWGGFAVLGANRHEWLGVFLALAAAGHAAVGLAFLVRQGDEHLFGNLVAGTGAALLALAAFEQLGAPLIPVAWAAQAAALAWLAVRRLHLWSALGACGLGSLAVAHVGLVEYPLRDLALRAGPATASPWLNPQAGALMAVLAAIAFTVSIAPSRSIRSGLVALGVTLAGYGAMFEAGGAWLVAVLVGLALLALELDALIELLGTRPDLEPLERQLPREAHATVAAIALGCLAALAFFVVLYPPESLGAATRATSAAVPYTGAGAAGLAILLAGLGVAGARQGTRWIRAVLAGCGVLLAAWSVPFELAGAPERVGALAVLLPVAAVLEHAIARLPGASRFARLKLPAGTGGITTAAGALAWAAGLWTAAAGPLDPTGWGRVTPPPIPFTSEAALVAVVLASAMVGAGAWLARSEARQLALLASLVPLALVVPLEVYADFVVVGWIALAGLALRISGPGAWARPAAVVAASALGVGAIGVAFAYVAPPDRLWVADPLVGARPPLLSGWWVSIAVVAAVPYAASRQMRFREGRSALEILAAALAVYLVSVGVVDVFARTVGGPIRTEELAKQAQVALSVTWTAIGALALGVGLYTRRAMLRHIGFGLLGLATAKVFVVDLAAMDVAYRALVLAGLGVLLLVSAWLVSSLRAPRAGTRDPKAPA